MSLLGALFLLTIMGSLALAATRRPTARRAARSILEQQKALHLGRHEFRRVSPSDFPKLDPRFYDGARDWLAGKGFEFVGDAEDLTLSAAVPSARTFTRLLVHESGTICAEAGQIVFRGFTRLKLALASFPYEIRIISFRTEFSDGSFLTTANDQGVNRLSEVRGVQRIQRDPDFPLPSLLEAHEIAISRTLARNPGLTMLAARSYEEVMESGGRLQDLKNVHRQKVGFVTEDEICRLANTQAAAKLLNEELHELRKP